MLKIKYSSNSSGTLGNVFSEELTRIYAGIPGMETAWALTLVVAITKFVQLANVGTNHINQSEGRDERIYNLYKLCTCDLCCCFVSATEEQRKVTYLWASPLDHFGLKDSVFKLKCIFAGK